LIDRDHRGSAMPDPLMITAASLLGAKALEAFSGEAGKSAWAVVGRLGELVRAKFESDKAAQAALAAVEASPTDEVQIETLAEVLRIRAEHDSDFASSLANLVADARASGALQIVQSDYVGFATVGDVYIGTYSPPPPPEKKRPTGQILSPESGQRVPRAVRVEGTLSDIPTEYHIWLAVQIGNLLWPKEPEIPSKDYHWSQRIVEGDPPGGRFSLALVMVDSHGQRIIKEWIKDGRSTGDWPGLFDISGTKLHVVQDLVLG
jgi:hypothetical protein